MTEHNSKCAICGTAITVEFCCSGDDCGCAGRPIEPPICNNDECYRRFSLREAAPMMLEALEMVAEWNGDPNNYLNLDDVRAAIKAAKGEI